MDYLENFRLLRLETYIRGLIWLLIIKSSKKYQGAIYHPSSSKCKDKIRIQICKINTFLSNQVLEFTLEVLKILDVNKKNNNNRKF